MSAVLLAAVLAVTMHAGKGQAVTRPCAPPVHNQAVTDGTALAKKLLAAVKRGDSPEVAALIAAPGLTVADDLIPRADLLMEMGSPDTPLHQYLYDTAALRRTMKSVNPVMSLQDFARKATKVTIEVKTNCFYEEPMAFVQIAASNLANQVSLSLVPEKGAWRIQCLPDFSC